jgi:hypothetical protein
MIFKILPPKKMQNNVIIWNKYCLIMQKMITSLVLCKEQKKFYESFQKSQTIVTKTLTLEDLGLYFA